MSTTVSFSLIQAPGIQLSTVQLQAGAASGTGNLLTAGSGVNSSNIVQHSGIENIGNVGGFEGVSQDGFITNPSQVETTAGANFNVFFPDFSRGTFLSAVVGTTGTIEKFFDRSPFFFTPSETDPNTLRDISEAQQFLIFSKTSIASYNFVQSTAGKAVVMITDSIETVGLNAINTGPPSLEQVVGGLGITPPASGTSSEIPSPVTFSGADSINIIDITGPFFDETSPGSGTTFNDPATQVEFHIKDLSSPILNAGTDVWIDGTKVVENNSALTGGTWPTIQKTTLSTDPANIEYVLTRATPFDLQSTVTVSGNLVDFADVGSNTTITEYSFQIRGESTLSGTISGSPDADAPIITAIQPADLDTQISPNTTLTFTVFDVAAGVDATTLKLYVDGDLKINGAANVLEGSLATTGSAQDGFTYIYTPASMFGFNETVTGTVQVDDLAVSPNTGSLTYTFTTTPDDTLEITNFFLASEESVFLDEDTTLTVDVIDATHGVNVANTTLTIDGDDPGFTKVLTASGLTFSGTLLSLVDFREDLDVLVHAENNFPGVFPVIIEETFVLRPGYKAIWENRDGDQSESIFPYLTYIQVLADAFNFAKVSRKDSLFYRFFTEHQASTDLGATIESNIKVADLSATLTSINPFFEYGKTITIEVEASDLEGNTLIFTHTFTIEQK